MLLRRYNALLFDMDGTLIDSMPVWERAYFDALVGDVLTEDEFPAFRELIRKGGDPVREYFPYITEEERLLIYKKVWKNFLRNVDAVRALLDEKDLLLVIDGRPAAVVTQTHSSIARRVLKEVGILHLFDALVSSDMVRNPKPHPEHVWRTLDELGEFPAVLIGDSVTDEMAAHNAGIDFVHARVVHRVRGGNI